MSARHPRRPRCLVPRGGAWGERASAALAAAGWAPLVGELIRTVPVEADQPRLATAMADLAGGAYDWLVVTSAAVVPVLVSPAPGTRVAAVGAATAAALERAGIAVDAVPPAGQPASAHGLLAAWPPPGDGPARILAPRSDQASDLLPDRLRAGGHRVTTVVAYRTEALTLPPSTLALLASGELDAALVTSGSVARSLAAQPVTLPERLRVVCLGEPSADAAHAAGLTVTAVAATADLDGLVAALGSAEALGGRRRS